MRLTAHGIDVDVPQGWDGEIYRRSGGFTTQGVKSESPNPVLHIANFPMPATRGDYGSGAVEVMGSDSILIVLFEFGPESVGKALFSTAGIPTTNPADFATNTLQRPQKGQSGAQYFFTERGRAFCLYVVLGSHPRRNELVPEVNQVLKTIDLDTL
ncbi:MAG: hypothetical protein WBM90_12300 [Acidimicrobiia bacterium]